MKSFKINKRNIHRLKLILKVLFPEFRGIKVKKNGIIVFRKSVYSIFSTKSHLYYLLAPSGEIITRLAKLRYDSLYYIPIYNEYLEVIIANQDKYDVVSCLIAEFEKIKKTKVSDIFSERVLYQLVEDSEKETIGDILRTFVTKKVTKPKSIILNSIRKEYKEMCLSKESLVDKKDRARFLSLLKAD